MLNAQPRQENCERKADGDIKQAWFMIEPCQQWRAADGQNRDAGAKRHVDPKQLTYQLMIKLRPLDRCSGKSHVLKHSEETDENCNHANQPIILWHEQARQHNSRGSADQEFADLRGERKCAATGGPIAQCLLQVISPKMTVLVNVLRRWLM